MIHKIGILTSGGDAPGMNNAIRATTISALNKGMEVYGVIDGYKGLVKNEFIKLDRNYVKGIASYGGTVLGTARLPEFKEESVRKIAVENLRKEGIEALIVIGGDGSYMGAKRLTEMGINCIGLPGTIDNDIASTEYTIGFDTALNTIIEALDRLNDTMTSHNRAAVVEIMGNHCGDLTVFSGLAIGADVIVSPDHPIPEEDIIARMNELAQNGQRSALVLVTEKMDWINVKDLTKAINEKTPWEAKAEILAHIQRGGRPTFYDRYVTSLLSSYAVDCIVEGKGGVCIGLKNGLPEATEIMEALAMPRKSHPFQLSVVDKLR